MGIDQGNQASGHSEQVSRARSSPRPMKVAPELLSSLEWRCIGPQRGSRVVAVAGHPTEPMVFYFGGTGGVWKTVDGGTYWENVSDGSSRPRP